MPHGGAKKKKKPQNTQKINKLHDFFRISDEDNFMTQTNARVHAYFIVQSSMYKGALITV